LRYKDRNVVERRINRLEQLPAVATSYDRREQHVPGAPSTSPRQGFWLRDPDRMIQQTGLAGK
jgi:hypothetical protein